MLNVHRKPMAPTGAAKLHDLLKYFSSPSPGAISDTDDKILGRVWSALGPLHSGDGPKAQENLLVQLGEFLLDHRTGYDRGLSVYEANKIVHFVNRVQVGEGGGLDYTTLGMVATAAVLAPSGLQNGEVKDIAKWFTMTAVSEFGLEHLLPTRLSRALCEAVTAGDGRLAQWMREGVPSFHSRFPEGGASRQAALEFLLGPEEHCLDYLRPLLSGSGPSIDADSLPSRTRKPCELLSGEIIDFRIDGNSDEYCLPHSWHPPESNFRWGMSPSALLEFCPVVSRSSNLMLIINLDTTLTSMGHQHGQLSVMVGKRAVFRDICDLRMQHRLVLNIGTAPDQGTVVPVAFQLWPPFIPEKYGIPDSRALGPGLSTLRLVAW